MYAFHYLGQEKRWARWWLCDHTRTHANRRITNYTRRRSGLKINARSRSPPPLFRTYTPRGTGDNDGRYIPVASVTVEYYYYCRGTTAVSRSLFRPSTRAPFPSPSRTHMARAHALGVRPSDLTIVKRVRAGDRRLVVVVRELYIHENDKIASGSKFVDGTTS